MSTSENSFYLGQLMRSGKYSDLTLVCGGHEFKVHKAVVCPQSRVLAVAVDGAFEEAKTGVINIEGFEPETVRRMVDFLYTGNYDNPSSQQTEADSSTTELKADDDVSMFPPETISSVLPVSNEDMVQHVRLNAIADYYNIPKLTELANSKLKNMYRDKWDSQAFLNATKEALASTGDKSLHKMMAGAVAQNIKRLLSQDQLGELINDFGVEVLRNHVIQAEEAEENLRSRLWQFQGNLALEEARRQSAEARTDRVIGSIGACIQTLKERDDCRNTSCSADFECYIEQRGQPSDPIYILRCARCRCKH